MGCWGWTQRHRRAKDGADSVRVWDLVAGKEQFKLDTSGMGYPVNMMATSADARVLAVSSQDCTMKVFNLQSGK